MSVDQRIVTATEQLEADVKLTHDIVNGDENTEIQTEGGPVPTHAKVAKDSHDEVIGLLQPTVNDINQHAAYVDGKVNEVEADANRAEAAADRADTIAELETVRDALRLAAVPAPDFHLPLISDLRIKEGFGDHDKIDVSAAQDGSVMVDLPTKSGRFSRASAKWYVNKSGVLTKAEVDEPALEKNGILIEGQSTNLINTAIPSDDLGGGYYISPERSNYLNTTVELPYGNQGTATDFTFIDNGYIRIRDSARSGSDKAISIFLKTDFPFTVRGVIKNSGYTQGLLEVSNTGEILSSKNINSNIEFVNGWLRVCIYDPAATDSISFEFKMGENVIMWGGQAEALKKSSSYILTEGTPATRAGDYLHLDTRNLKTSGYTMAYNLTVNNNMRGVSGYYEVLSQESTTSVYFQRNLHRVEGGEYKHYVHSVGYGGDIDEKEPVTIVVTYGEGATETIASKHCVYINGVKVVDEQHVLQREGKYNPVYRFGGGIGFSNASFHIRDLRIWGAELIEEKASVLG